MGVPSTGGAQGRITIDTSQLAEARAAVNAFATGVSSSLGSINPTISKTQSAFAGLTGSIQSVAGAFGISLGVSGAIQLGKAAVAATQLATAYNRQEVAARSLAGGQTKLNSLMATYDKATGGAVDKAEALQNVTKLMSVGFADNSEELEKFARAIRGISIAMGTSQDTVTQNLILELFTQRGARLDQLGLQYDKVRARSEELQAADASLTTQMAYQQAVLEQAEKRFGALGDSVAGQATGVEKLTKAWADMRLEIGQELKPNVEQAANDLTRLIDLITRFRALNQGLQQEAISSRAAQEGRQDPFGPAFSRTSIGRVPAQAFGNDGAIAPGTSAEARAIHLDWAQGIEDLNRQVHADIIDEEQSFGQSRAKVVADYAKAVGREEEAFGRQRLRAEIDQLDAIQGVMRDATRREQGAAADLARSLESRRADSAEREIELREDANKRLAELDENYERDRMKRAKDLSDDLLDAAGQLDAKQVYELQRNAAKQEQEAKEAHDEQRSKIQENLDERLDDERKALDKSTRQLQDSYDRQIEEGRENDRIRLQDMADDFAKRKAREDEDRAIRNSQRAEDQAAQLNELDKAHGLRLNQIRTHAIEERAALQEAADKALVEAKAADEATRKRVEAKEKHLEDLWDKFHDHIAGTLGETVPRTLKGGPIKAYALGGYVDHTGLAYLHAGETVIPANNSRSSVFSGNVSVTIAGSTNMGRGDIKRAVIEAMTEVLEEAA